jgi:hypothetical protein
MLKVMRKLLVVGGVGVSLTACSALYDMSVDPGDTVPVNTVFKSLRCEVVTFLAANRARRAEFDKAVISMGYRAAFAKFVYIDIDNTKFGGLQVDLKTIDALGMSLGIDWKAHVDTHGRFHTWHIGPALNGTKTYTQTNVFAIPQDGKLGPSQRGTPSPRLSGDADAEDSDFFCYLEQRDAPKLKAELKNFEALAAHQIPEVENFDRIYIDGKQPLAQWLMETLSAEAAKSSLARQDYMESAYAGQLQYSFALDVKPSMDLKYTLVATVINPYIPDFTASRDSSGTFTLALNTYLALAAAGARGGNASIAAAFPGPPKPLEVWGPNRPNAQRAGVPAFGGRIAPETAGRRGPGVILDYPLPLTPLPLPQPGQ